MSIIPTMIKSREQYEELISKQDPVMLYFSSQNCNVCHAVLPEVLELVEEYPVEVAQIKVDELPEIAGQSLVFTVPTILMMYEGREILRESRFIDFATLEKTLGLLQP
ncbi:thioredoxin family protein [Desulfitobacterium sp. Sab5]|uniref:thioredoxin family protein n=1 Tax=Desulfitobacterium nosdiversum TaxID=3375356 RepID=UPI003CF33F68